MTIEQLQQEEKDLKLRLKDNASKQRALNAEHFASKTGLHIGDAVEHTPKNKIVLSGVISRYVFSKQNHIVYGVKIRLFNKNGTVSSQEYSTITHENIKVIKKAE